MLSQRIVRRRCDCACVLIALDFLTYQDNIFSHFPTSLSHHLNLVLQTQFSAIRVKLESGNDELQQKVAEFKGICDRKDEELSALEEICTHKEVVQRSDSPLSHFI